MNKIILNIFTTLLFSLFLISSAQAQNKRIITLKTCIDSALTNYPSLKAFEKIEESRSANSKSLQNQLLPELDFAFQYQYNVYKEYEYRTLDNHLQLVWDMGKWTGKLEQAGITEEKIAQFKSLQNKLDLIYRVKHAFYKLISAGETMRIAKLSESYLEHHLAVNEKLYSIGQIKELDFYFTQSGLLRAKEDVLAAQSEIESWQIQLSNLTGFNLSSTDSLEMLEEFTFSRKFSVDSLLEEAHRFNPAVSILEKQTELVNIQANLIRNSRMPKIYLGGGYVFDSDPTSGGNYSKISGGLLIPIFDWGTRSNKVQSFQLKAESIKSTELTLLLELKTKLKSLVNRMDNIKKLLALKDTSIKQAQKTYNLTLINYKAGISTNTDVLLAQKALIESKISKEKLIFLLYEIESQIENLVGKPEVKQ
ncbi:outer membrane efflux protein [bacterium BMS3Abin03]|nr:outer membrane efflux protein [bacterium BMS3Abin03]